MDSPTRYGNFSATVEDGVLSLIVHESADGEYVLHSDYALLKAKYEEAQAEIEKLKGSKGAE
jgi:hydrogenase maturation factor